jgi:hypothetical protein
MNLGLYSFNERRSESNRFTLGVQQNGTSIAQRNVFISTFLISRECSRINTENVPEYYRVSLLCSAFCMVFGR